MLAQKETTLDGFANDTTSMQPSRNHSNQRKVTLQGTTTMSSKEATRNNSVNTSIMKGLELINEHQSNQLSLTGESIQAPLNAKKQYIAAEIAKAAALAH